MKKCVWIILVFLVCICPKGDSQIITTIAGNGTEGIGGNGGPATAAQLGGITCIQFDKYGNLYIGDANTYVVHKVDTNGIITVFAGTLGSAGYTGDGGPATAAQLHYAGFMAFDKAGDLYVSDEGNNVIRKVDTSGIITTYAGTGLSGSSGDGGPAIAATFEEAAGIAVDDSDNLYIVDNIAFKVRRVNHLYFTLDKKVHFG